MIVLRKTQNSNGVIDGTALNPDTLGSLSLTDLQEFSLPSSDGPIKLREVFEVAIAPESDPSLLIIEGDCRQIDLLGARLASGTICVLGNVGNRAGQQMQGGSLIVVGDAKDQLGCAMRDGMIYVAGDCGERLVGPLPGKRSGMRGGDVIVAGNVGSRACERMRRGTVVVAGNTGTHAASQMVAGTLIVMGGLGAEWAGGMRRGSLILLRDYNSCSAASMSEPRDFELSFLPLIWKHLDAVQLGVMNVLDAVLTKSENIGKVEIPKRIKFPSTRWVQRQIADINCEGKGEVLVLRRNSSPGIA